MSKRIILLCLVVLLLTACEQKAPQMFEKTEALYGTVIQVKAYGVHAESAIQKAFERAKGLEQVFSTTLEGSELNQLNKQAAQQPVVVSTELFTVIREALNIARRTDGALDPTIGNLIDLWGIGTASARVPTDSEIQANLIEDGYKMVELDESKQSVYFLDERIKLNLGAIAKGYISDEMKKVLVDAGIRSAILNLGGNVMTLGKKIDGTHWKVGVTNPSQPTSILPGISIEVLEGAVVSSGDYERFFIENDNRYHHIIDPKTGYPSNSGLHGTTIIAPSGILGDALSTATFVLGLEASKALIEEIPDVQAYFVDFEGNVTYVEGAE